MKKKDLAKMLVKRINAACTQVGCTKCTTLEQTILSILLDYGEIDIETHTLRDLLNELRDELQIPKTTRSAFVVLKKAIIVVKQRNVVLDKSQTNMLRLEHEEE